MLIYERVGQVGKRVHKRRGNKTMSLYCGLKGHLRGEDVACPKCSN